MKPAELIAELISGPSGLHVGFDDLSVYRLEDGRYAVNWNGNPPRKTREDWECLFVDPNDAARFFETKRKEYELGFEFES